MNIRAVFFKEAAEGADRPAGTYVYAPDVVEALARAGETRAADMLSRSLEHVRPEDGQVAYVTESKP